MTHNRYRMYDIVSDSKIEQGKPNCQARDIGEKKINSPKLDIFEI